MSNSIVECIPNFSEGRRPEVVEAIVDSIRKVSGVWVLDYSSDEDHNRTVVTFAGPPAAVEEAAFQAIAQAAQLIDLDQHQGEHPRVGAADVVPLVPISGVKMKDCVEMAKRLGKRVGEELDLPVYLYEEAATRPERRNLENIRRGEYEALKEEIASDPGRAPDFGPAQVGPAGATVIGARQPLIAYNVYLNTDEVSIAKKVARAVRHSSGGLRYVKGLGLLVDGQAQVSMNLTNYKKTPVARVVEMIRREAARYGVEVSHSELIGLIPQDALIDAAAWHLQLDDFERDQVLETRLYAVQKEEAPPDFLEALASSEPTPGGGSAAAYTAAAGAALTAMVARVSMGKKKYASIEAEMQTVLEEAERLRAELTVAVDRDAAAFNGVMAAFRLPKETPEQKQARSEAIQAATLEAARVPMEVVGMAVAVMGLAVQVVTLGNINAISDGGSGAALARAALTGAGLNVRINLASLKDSDAVEELLAGLRSLEKEAAGYEAQVNDALVSRGGLELAKPFGS